MGVSTLSPQDEQALKDITKTPSAMLHSRGLERWMSTCSDDVILLPPDLDGTHGLEAGLEMLETFPPTLEFEGEPSVIKGSGDMALHQRLLQGRLSRSTVPDHRDGQ